jgi:hypothetical protein
VRVQVRGKVGECRYNAHMSRNAANWGRLTLFLNCLWMASSASLMVTPFMFRALTSRPSGKWRVIFLTLGMHKGRARNAGSSTVVGDLFSFLCCWLA